MVAFVLLDIRADDKSRCYCFGDDLAQDARDSFTADLLVGVDAGELGTLSTPGVNWGFLVSASEGWCL